MPESTIYLLTAAFTVIGVTAVSLVALRGWRDWIALKTRELEQQRADSPPTATSRIEVADLKERIRKLEAIAAGVEL
ncbi:hypothetical protein SAMN02745824_2398 [Parasphingorhabdus marina DSM 22363]|uniref:Uncharacterized protein n=1 Tax=Parasphingorhabdus marina DSM 22363 TaxID=1123272 RepID=A0A1N6FHS8_9SPHN|nr:hypothetical protein [Parasphingorhabdus marina]SIN94756.1 hypothetical protein SAMN02745824_2398 [Parasphingorhabdus marina DSM 22363]